MPAASFITRTLSLVLLLLPVPGNSLQAQKLAEDTVFVTTDSLLPGLPMHSFVSEVRDVRRGAEGLLSYGSKKRYLLLPVDVLFCSRPPLDKVLQGDIIPHYSNDSWSVEIRDFNISKRKGNFFPAWVLDAELAVMKQVYDTVRQEGVFLYHTSYPVVRREKQADACKRALQAWRFEFAADLAQLDSGPPGTFEPDFPFWFPGENVPVSHLNLVAAAAAGWNFRQLEAELFFSYAEKNSKYVYTTGIIRYQKTPDFESIAFGRQIEHLLFRINPSWAYDSYYAPLLGFNKWKNFAENDPGLWQIIQMSLSTAQTISFSPVNSLIHWKGGVFANAIYIPQKKPIFQLGLYTSVGFRF
jgi:hypothetical protein